MLLGEAPASTGQIGMLKETLSVQFCSVPETLRPGFGEGARGTYNGLLVEDPRPALYLPARS